MRSRNRKTGQEAVFRSVLCTWCLTRRSTGAAQTVLT